MNMVAEPVVFESPRALLPEDQSRADYYGLLANLFYRAPTDALLQAIVIAPPPGGGLAAAWNALAAASAVVSHEAVEEEYNQIFIGVGRPPVVLYGSFYMAGFMMEKPLAELRDSLRTLGFERDESVREPEDHLAAVCDVMRALILGDIETKPASVEVQRQFFQRHLEPWIVKACAAISAYDHANYYRRVADFAAAFFALEVESFSLEA